MSWSTAWSPCGAPAPSFSPAPRCAPPIAREAIDGRDSLRRDAVRALHLRAGHDDPRRRRRLGGGPGAGADLAPDGNDRALHAVPHRGRPLPALRALRRAAPVVAFLPRRLSLDFDRSGLRLSRDARGADGDPVFLSLRARRAELARQERGVSAWASRLSVAFI